MNALIYALHEKPKKVGCIMGMDVYSSPDMPKDIVKVFDGAGNCVAILKVLDVPRGTKP